MNRRQSLQTLLASAAASSLFSRIADAAPCPMIGLHPVLWTPAGTQLPPDGALVLTLAQGGGFGPGGSFFDTVTPALRGERGAVAFETRDVAPSVRLLIPRQAPRGGVTVTGLAPASVGAPGTPGTPATNGPVSVRFGSAAVAPIAAPVLRSVQTQTSTSMGPRGGMTFVSSTATLGAPAPADAAFLLLMDPRIANGVAMSGVPVTAGATAFGVFSSGHRCGPPNLNQQPAAGMRLVARFVDRYGRLGPVSNEATATG